MNAVKRTAASISVRTLIQTRTYQSGGRENMTSKLEIEPKILLSEKNRQRCLKSMNSSAPINIKLKGITSEKAFAAVLIAICTDENEYVTVAFPLTLRFEKMQFKKCLICSETPSILYTRRSRTLRRHMSQISFPGGIKENNEDFIRCALRETEEEIGLLPNRVEIWGAGGLITPPHTAAIMPIIGVVRNFSESELHLNPSEVEEAFTVPISCLANPCTLRYTQFQTGYSAPVFIVGDKKIWGITGFLTNTFLNCFLPLQMNALRGRVKFIKPYRGNVK